MKRGIAMDGVIDTKPAPKPSYRSADGSDLPARVHVAAQEFAVANGFAATHVRLGSDELAELRQILSSGYSASLFDSPMKPFPNVRVAGLRVEPAMRHRSLLEVY